MPNLQTALRLASHDKEFADALLKSPENFSKAFNLSESHVAGLRKAAADGLVAGGLKAGDYNMS